MTNWQNPYENPYENWDGQWLKGNLHAHTAPVSPCATISPERVLALYEAKGYDFLSVSDHMRYTAISQPTRLTLIPGLEWNSRTALEDLRQVVFKDHIGLYALDGDLLEQSVRHRTPGQVLQAMADKAVLIVLNHPNWLVPHHYTEEVLLNLYQSNYSQSIHGIEIYNAVIENWEGHPEATMKWDRILTDKGPLLGFASDDSHRDADIGKAWIMVNAAGNRPADILAGIRAGRFYCSTGVAIREIGRDGDQVFCRAGRQIEIKAVGNNSRVLAASTGELVINFQETEAAYIRFALYGPGKQMAWSQPFFK